MREEAERGSCEKVEECNSGVYTGRVREENEWTEKMVVFQEQPLFLMVPCGLELGTEPGRVEVECYDGSSLPREIGH